MGRSVFWQVPNDPKSVVDSRNSGIPLLQHAPKCKAQHGIAGLCQALCGKQDPQAAKSGRSWGIFSRK
jgi:pilus assembly protein CpaE